MVETIAPVVYGNRRRYLTAVFLHTLAAGVTGAVFGALLGAIGLALGGPWGDGGAIVVGVVAVVYAARELFGLPVPIFDRKRQVPDWWRTFYSPNVTATLYGAGLGIGYLTFLRYGTYVVVSVAAVASADPLVGGAFGGAFGLARGATSLVASRTRDEDEAGLVVVGLEKVAEGRGPRLVNGLACLALAVVAFAVLV